MCGVPTNWSSFHLQGVAKVRIVNNKMGNHNIKSIIGTAVLVYSKFIRYHKY